MSRGIAAQAGVPPAALGLVRSIGSLREGDRVSINKLTLSTRLSKLTPLVFMSEQSKSIEISRPLPNSALRW
ncbi:MAG: hypothetical protein ACI915_001763 [Gammaproteobacteria bacterium]|jgi:hypothetical protein